MITKDMVMNAAENGARYSMYMQSNISGLHAADSDAKKMLTN
jgi:hypothetical protein